MQDVKENIEAEKFNFYDIIELLNLYNFRIDQEHKKYKELGKEVLSLLLDIVIEEINDYQFNEFKNKYWGYCYSNCSDENEFKEVKKEFEDESYNIYTIRMYKYILNNNMDKFINNYCAFRIFEALVSFYRFNVETLSPYRTELLQKLNSCLETA